MTDSELAKICQQSHMSITGCNTPSLEATPMQDYLVHQRCIWKIMHNHPDIMRPQQPCMHMMAYLSTHTCLTHGQIVSGPMALAGLMEAHHLQLILTHTHPQSDSSPCHPSDFTISIGHPTYILVPMQHNHLTLLSD